MSNAITQLCRAVQCPPTQKAVLMCLADYCHDDGRDWHSLAAIMAWTCLGRTAVIEALKGLEARGLLNVERAVGRNSITFLNLQTIEAATNPSATRTSPPDGPVRQTDHTRPPDVPPPVRVADGPVRQTDPKHQEASDKHKKEKDARVPALRSVPELIQAEVLIAAGFDSKTAADFIAHKSRVKAPLTARAWVDHLRESQKAGWTPAAAAEKVMARSWKGFEAKYVANEAAPGVRSEPPEPAWRREQRERNEAFLGPAAAKRSATATTTATAEVIDVTSRLLG